MQLLKTMGLGRLTCEDHSVAVWSRPPAPSRPVESVVHLALMEKTWVRERGNDAGTVYALVPRALA